MKIRGYLAERRRATGDSDRGSFASKFNLFLTDSSLFRLGSLKPDPLSFWLRIFDVIQVNSCASLASGHAGHGLKAPYWTETIQFVSARPRYLRLLMSPKGGLSYPQPWKAPFFRPFLCTHEQRSSSACIHTRSICGRRGRSFPEPKGNERVSRTLEGSNGPARDARLTSANCRSEDGTSPNQTAKHYPGKECRVHSLEIAKVSGPRAMFSLWHMSKTWCYVCLARLVLDDQRPAIRNRCLSLLEEEDDVVRYVASIPLLDW